MPWFAAHAIMYFKWKNGPQDKFNVWENVLLVEADDHAGAWRAAELITQDTEGDSDGSLTDCGHPATQVFAGLRKVAAVLDARGSERPKHGDEVTFNTYVVSDLASVEALAAGKRVPILHVESEEAYRREDLDAET